MKITALQAIPAPMLIAAGLVAPPLAGAYPTGPCARSDIGTVVQDVNAYTLCTGVGWVHVSGRVKRDPSGREGSPSNPGPLLGGINVDVDEVLASDYGQWDLDR